MSGTYSYSNRHRLKAKLKEDPNKELNEAAEKARVFITKLGEIQDAEFEKLYEEAKHKNWLGNVEPEVGRDYLFDYCFNNLSSEKFTNVITWNI